MDRHLYFYMENLGLNDSQRNMLKDWFMAFNGWNNPQPQFNMHSRVRLDGEADYV